MAGRGASPSGGCARACWCSEGAAAVRPPEPAALLGRHAGEEAHSLLRNAAWPQASAVFSKEVLTFVSLRVQQACVFLLLGVVVGNDGELPSWGFKKYITRQQGAGTKDTSLPEENSVLSATFLPFPSCKTPWAAFCLLLCSQASYMLCEPDTWPARGSTATCLLSGAAFHFLSEVRPMALCPAHLRHISISSALRSCC